jgi:16S rRNA (adenine1518-N6/adenine1519-N6)-dimethyltransferase
MMQKEVADRIMASPGTKDYGSLSIAVQYYCTAEEALRVPRSVFLPPPNVDSSVFRLTIRAQPAVLVQSETTFFAIVRAAFAQRRKTISNNMLRHFAGRYSRAQIDEILHECAIDPSQRAEALAMADFARLADKLTS